MQPLESAMPCPRCHEDAVEPLSGSSAIVAWYTCPRCDHFWSARIRNGHPIDEPETPVAVPAPRRA